MHYVEWNKEKIESFWDTYGSLPELEGHWFGDNATGWLVKQFNGLNKLPCSRVLDIGFGNGSLLKALAKSGHNCFGVDTSPKLVNGGFVSKAHILKHFWNNWLFCIKSPECRLKP